MSNPVLFDLFAALMGALAAAGADARRASVDAARIEARRSSESAWRAWRRLVDENAHLLVRHGAPALLQMAIGEGEGSPVAAAARRWIERGCGPGLAWDGPVHQVRREGFMAILDGKPPAVFVPERGWIVAPGGEGLRIWDAETGVALRSLPMPDERPPEWRYAMALHRDGRTLRAWVRPVTPEGLGEAIHFWDLDRGERTRVLWLPRKTFKLWVARDERTAVLAVEQSTVRLDLVTGEQTTIASDVRCLGLDDDGRRFLGVRAGQRVGIFDVTTGQQIGVTNVSTSGGYDDLEMLRDPESGLGVIWSIGAWASTSAVSVHDLATGEQRWSKPLHLHRFVDLLPGGRVLTLILFPEGEGWCWQLARWDLATGALVGEVRVPAIDAGSIRILPDGRRLLTVGQSIRCIDIETGASETWIADHRPSYAWCGPSLSPDARRLVTTTEAGPEHLVLWDLEELAREQGRSTGEEPLVWSGDVVAAIEPEGEQPTASFRRIDLVVALADGRHVAVIDGSPVRIWDAVTGRCVAVLWEEHGVGWSDVAPFRDGRRLLTINRERHVIWDLSTRTPLRETQVDDRHEFMHLFPDERRALITDWHDGVILWDLEENRDLDWVSDELHAHLQHAQIAVDPRGERVAFLTRSRPDTVAIHDPATGAVVRSLVDPGASVWSIVFHVIEGRLALLSVNTDGLLACWDVTSGACVHRHALGAGARAIVADPDGPRALVGGEDGVLRLVDVVTGEIVARRYARAAVTTCAALGGGRYVMGDALGGLHFLALRR
ncbi:MAG: WD40 repeat domain-containing protein [Minicystis sp.]